MKSKLRIGKGKFLCVIATIFLLALSHQAVAINIIPIPLGSSVFPSTDPTGRLLDDMMEAAAQYYEDVFEMPGDLTIDYKYANISSLGRTDNYVPLLGTPNYCRIRISANEDWFIDTTPFDNSEFNMSQTLAFEIPNNQDVYYDAGSAGVPDLLEAIYSGWAKPGTAASGAQDLWSTILHEIGHAMGMTGSSAWDEVNFDDDYDFYSSAAWGFQVAAECASTSGDDRFHLALGSNMHPGDVASKRNLPSATDFFAIARAGERSGPIDLMRKDFYRGGASLSTDVNLNDHDNWAGGMRPDSTEDAFIRDTGNCVLEDSNLACKNLRIALGAVVYTEEHTLTACQNCIVGVNIANPGSVNINHSSGKLDVLGDLTINSGQVRLWNGAELEADLIKVNGGTLRLTGNAEINASKLQLEHDADLVGSGFIRVTESSYLSGTVTTNGGQLTIVNSAPFDLDGGEANTWIKVYGGDFVCSDQITDAFGGRISIANGYDFTMGKPWSMNGDLELVGTGAIKGQNCAFHGDMEINGDLNVYSDITFGPNCDVYINGTAGDLYLRGDAEIWAGAHFASQGEFWVEDEDATCNLRNGVEIGTIFKVRGKLTIASTGVGDVTIDNHLRLKDSAELLIDIWGDNGFDHIDVDGTAYLDGILKFNFPGSYEPDDGQSFTIMNYNGRSGTFDSFTCTGLPGFYLGVGYGGNSVTITAYEIDNYMATVPEPSTIVLLLAAGCCLVFLRKRRS